MQRERNLLRKLGICAGLLVLVLLSHLVLAGYVSSPELHAESLAALDEKKVTVMELTGATTAASVAVSAVPGDATTPIANQISELSSYLLLVVGAILLEKVLLTLTRYAAFGFLIPAALILAGIALFKGRSLLLPLAAKLAVFSLAICLVIPVSLQVGTLVEDTLELQQTIDLAQQAAEDTEEEAAAAEEEDSSLGGWLSQVGDALTAGVDAVIQQAEQTISRFIDAIAILLIVNCAIPLLVLWLFLWVTKAILGVQVQLPAGKPRKLSKRPKGDAPAQPEERETSLLP